MNVLVIINPRARPSEATLNAYLEALGDHGAEVTLRSFSGDATLDELLRDAADRDAVAAIGGDGTVSSVAYALRDTGVPVLAYPGGTANLIARNLRLPTDPAALAAATLAGRPAPIDLGELTAPARADSPARTVGFCVAAGAGFDAAIMETARGLKATIGEGAYVMGALQNLAPTVAQFTLELDGKAVETEGIAVLVVNLARLQFDLAMAHGSDAQDGLLEVIVVKTRTAAGLLPTVWAAMLDRVQEHPQRPGLAIHSARHVSIAAEPPLPLQYDGELMPCRTPAEARVLPGAAMFIVPDGSPLLRGVPGSRA